MLLLWQFDPAAEDPVPFRGIEEVGKAAAVVKGKLSKLDLSVHVVHIHPQVGKALRELLCKLNHGVVVLRHGDGLGIVGPRLPDGEQLKITVIYIPIVFAGGFALAINYANVQKQSLYYAVEAHEFIVQQTQTALKLLRIQRSA